MPQIYHVRDFTGAQWLESRQVIRRIEVRGTLRLTSPAHFGNGNGEAGEEVDMPLLRDTLNGAALLPGASLAGALRNYLWERQFGYGVMPQPENERHRKAWAVLLFGGLRQDDAGTQSPLIVDDALAEDAPSEVRDGVKIDPVTRTAEDGAKYDVELLQAGVTFELHFELIISEAKDATGAVTDNEAALRAALSFALQGLETGHDITLGARKKRGYGACQVVEWQVREMDLRTRAGLLAWLERDGAWQSGPQIMPLLYPLRNDLLQHGEAISPLLDRRQRFDLCATFTIAPDSSLLIRGVLGALESGPDAMHIHRPELDTHGNPFVQPILPGTSWTGALRSRARRIAKTLHGAAGDAWVEQLFGGSDEESVTKQERYIHSRTEIAESVITGVEKAQSMVVNRIAIDRFTGGVLDNLLFDEMPLYAGDNTRLELRLRLRNPSEAEIGLMLQVLKDLWLGDLPVGGGVAIGRARLQGLAATLQWHHSAGLGEDAPLRCEAWSLTRTAVGGVQVRLGEGTVRDLETFAAELGKGLLAKG